MAAAELKIKQVRSASGSSPQQRDSLRTLRLGRIGSETKRPDTPELRGVLNTVSHLVSIEEAS